MLILGVLAGVWVFGALLLPVLLPFLIGLAVSQIAERPVKLLQTRAHMPRWLASGVCVLGLFAALFGGLFLLCRLLCGEAAGLVRELPALAQGLQAPVSRVKTWLIAMAALGAAFAPAWSRFSKAARDWGRSSMRRSSRGPPA